MAIFIKVMHPHCFVYFLLSCEHSSVSVIHFVNIAEFGESVSLSRGGDRGAGEVQTCF